MIDIIKSVEKNILEIDSVKIASDLVKIPSFSFMENQEEQVAGYLLQLFKNYGIECWLQEISQGRPNIVAVLRGSKDTYSEGVKKEYVEMSGIGSLMLMGHTDTVPAYDMENAFFGRIKENKLYGRGACDMKGPLAAMVAAIIGIKKSGVRLQNDLYFCGVVGEEESGCGAEYLVANGPATNGVIVGEPTNLAIARGQKGLEWIEVKVTGKKVHGGSADIGVNAIKMASRFVNRVYEDYTPILKSRNHRILGNPSINIGTIGGGDQPSTVAGSCTISLDRRCIPEETREQVYDELESIIKTLSLEDPDFKGELRDMLEGQYTLYHRPFFTDDEDPLIKTAQKYMGKKGQELTIFPAWTDAGTLANYTNSKCIIIGPGDLSVAHSPDEFIEIADIKKASDIYGKIALEYCGVSY